MYAYMQFYKLQEHEGSGPNRCINCSHVNSHKYLLGIRDKNVQYLHSNVVRWGFTHTHTNTHKHTQTHTHKHTQTHTQTHTHTHRGFNLCDKVHK
jgi:flagellar biogenesis protein FliO